MKANPILEEVWRIKDQLAAESGYDMARFLAQLRTWGGVALFSASRPRGCATSQLWEQC